MKYQTIFLSFTVNEFWGLILWIFIMICLVLSNIILRDENKELKKKVSNLKHNPPIKDFPIPHFNPKEVPYQEYKRVLDKYQKLKEQFEKYINDF